MAVQIGIQALAGVELGMSPFGPKNEMLGLRPMRGRRWKVVFCKRSADGLSIKLRQATSGSTRWC